MCARFTLRAPAEVVAGLFEVDEIPTEPPRYNIAPTQPVIAVIERKSGGRAAKHFHWGLIPSWAKEASIGSRLINARAESLSVRPAFKNPFLRRRCLIPADGFYEWMEVDESPAPSGEGVEREGLPQLQAELFGKADLPAADLKARPSTLDGSKARKPKQKKQPFYIGLKDFSVFAFAGLWDFWERPGETVYSCTIITTEPNDLVRPMHDRMPAIIEPEHYSAWLDRDLQEPSTLRSLLKPYPSEQMAAYPVSTIVNSANNETPECVAPILAPLFAPASQPPGNSKLSS